MCFYLHCLSYFIGNNHVYNGSFENDEEGWNFSDETQETIKTDEESIHERKAFYTSVTGNGEESYI